MGRRAAGQRGQDGAELRLAAAQRAGRRGRGGDRHARARLRAADRPRAGRRVPPRAAGLRGVARGRGQAPGERGPRGARAVPRRAARGRRRRAVRRRRRSAGSRSCALAAAELAIDADLAAGRHHELVGEIDALLAENPLRERLHAQRMLALYRCGRQAEALEAYRDARSTLVEEIGIEPSRRAAATCTRRSCARTRRWTSRPPPTSSRASSTPPRRRR